MKHTYIDIDKRLVFKDNELTKNKSKNKRVRRMENILRHKYKITNVDDDPYSDAWYFIALALQLDLDEERLNYESYIEEGMDARLMMELRKSALLPMSHELYDFYEGHRNLDTAKQVKEYRTEYLKFLNKDYDDADWQYYCICLFHLRSKIKTLDFNFECCFKDGDYDKYIPTYMAREMFLSRLGYYSLDYFGTWIDGIEWEKWR